MPTHAVHPITTVAARDGRAAPAPRPGGRN